MTKEEIIQLIKNIEKEESKKLQDYQAKVIPGKTVSRQTSRMITIHLEHSIILGILLEEIKKREKNENI